MPKNAIDPLQGQLHKIKEDIMTEEQTEVTPEQNAEVTDTFTQEPAQADTSTSVEPETASSEATNEQPEATGEQEAPEWLNKSKYKTVEDQAKAYSELESKATRDAIELSEIRKELDQLKQPKEPKLIDETGKVSDEFKQKHQLEIDNNEFLAYESISRSISDMETRIEVENILREAQGLYGYDKNAYSQKMDELKEYFKPNIIEKITEAKLLANQQFEQTYQSEIQKERQLKAAEVAKKIESVPELYQLVDDKSENFSPETFTIVKQLFDKYGDIDVELTTKAINSIKSLGVKEHLAKQEFEKTKQLASVPTGTNVKEVKSDLPTASLLAEKPELYTEMCTKFGMEKIDAIIAGKT